MRWFAVMMLMMAACAPSEAAIQALFEERVAESQACETDEQCTVISPGCPLGCWVAVNTTEADALAAYAQELISDYESGGMSCAYGCISAGEVACVEQICTLPE